MHQDARTPTSAERNPSSPGVPPLPDHRERLVIPSDLSACQALLEQQAFTIEEQAQTIEQLEQEKEELRLQLAELLQRAFRKRRERYIDNPEQLKLDFGASDDIVDAAAGLADAVEESEQQVAGYTRRKSKNNRDEKLPEHLPRYEVEAEVPDEVKHCATHGERKRIGYDTTETLEFERPKLRVRVTKYPKYACAEDELCGVSSPERPVSLVAGNRYDSSVAAEIITGKYGYHLPIYRQQDYFAGSGWTPGRSTLLNILQASAVVLRPLAVYLRELIVGSDLLGTDDTL